jgi:diketogulonate reductase-like aldo/keto reductase
MLYRNDMETLAATRGYQVYVTSKVSKKLINESDRDNRSIEEYARAGWDCVLLHMPTDNFAIAWEQLKRVPIDVGVSNFTPSQLAALSSAPMYNQIEVTPYNDCKETVEYCHANNIIVQAHSALTKKEKFADAKLLASCAEYNCTPASYLLNWSRARGYIPIFSSKNTVHIQENASNCIDVTPENWHCGYRTHPQYSC